MKIQNSVGLSFEFLENGSVKTIEAAGVRISLKPATLFSRHGTNFWLRIRKDPFIFAPLLGPESTSRFAVTEKSYTAEGQWEGLEYRCVLTLSGESLSWQWSIDIENRSHNEIETDLIIVQDLGLKAVTSGLVNEYYVSQYLERRILHDIDCGPVICCRQNMNEGAGNPWLMLACMSGAAAATTDGMQFFGRMYRTTGVPQILLSDSPGDEYAGESSVISLREKPVILKAGHRHRSLFAATFIPDHPEATSDNDLRRLHSLKKEFPPHVQILSKKNLTIPSRNLFNISPFLPAEDLNEDELDMLFGPERRHAETEDGKLLSFFYDEIKHVMLRQKENMADRPHGHIMQAAAGRVPDENTVSTTCFACGVFNSHLTQGNTNFNILLSICTSQFNLSPETGQRIFIENENQLWLLGVPSAFEMGLNHCLWIYKYHGYIFQVRSWTSRKVPQVNLDFRILQGTGMKILITNHFDASGRWRIVEGDKTGEYRAIPAPGTMISDKFPQAQFIINVGSSGKRYKAGDAGLAGVMTEDQAGSLFVIASGITDSFYMSFTGQVCSRSKPVITNNPDQQFITDCHDALSAWKELSMNLRISGGDKDIRAVSEILPWYGINALVHYLTPYGLEQFGGAAWGTRDVSQGPFDLLLSMGRYKEAAHVLRLIFSHQDPSGGWPQWWMFDSYRHIRADSAHGDVIYWCLIALSSYVRVTGDLSILDEVIPYFSASVTDDPERETIAMHADRIIRMIISSFMPGTALVPFGGGDWNDSLQPVNDDLAGRMISSWTVEMNYQAFIEYAEICDFCGNSDRANELRDLAGKIRNDFNRILVRNDVVAGYGIVEEDGSVTLLLHPDDTITGVRYSILPMERGIVSGIFTPEQARHHQGLIEEHLKGPDGARLMDRPLKYRGGIETIFRRAESSAFFGREIGLMYVHEHIRYAETLAITGKADLFLKALRQAIPISYREIVTSGDIRQSNCYYSSSDVIFRNRFEACDNYDQIKRGNIILRGGWRIYSSGPGIFIGIIITKFFGIRFAFGNIIIDPVMPRSADGVSVSMHLMGRQTTFMYHVLNGSDGPDVIRVNGVDTGFDREKNTYRRGGALIRMESFLDLLDREENCVEIEL